MSSKQRKIQKLGSHKRQALKILDQLSSVICLQPVIEDVRRVIELEIEGKFSLTKPPPTEACILEYTIVAILIRKNKLVIKLSNTRLGDVLKKLNEPERECFINLLCRLAYLKTCGFNPEIIDLSNELLRIGYSHLTSANTLELVDFRTLNEEPYTSHGNSYSFMDFSIQVFLTSIYLIHQPLMFIMEFIRNYILNKDSEVRDQCNESLQYLFGLADCGVSGIINVVLPHIVQFMCQCIPSNDPIIDNSLALVVLSCLRQAQDRNLYLKVHHEFFQKHILTYDMSLIADKIDDIALYLAHTTERNQWTIYCYTSTTGSLIANEVQSYGVSVKVREVPELVQYQQNRILISDSNIDTLRNIMEQIRLPTLPSSLSDSSSSGFSIPTSLPSSSAMSSFILTPSGSVYGHYSEGELEKYQKHETNTYFNMVKDCLVYTMQSYSHTVVDSQYRKGDHIWLVGSKNIRHDFYKGVEISPYCPVHWVKVKQPDGSREMEQKFKTLSIEMSESPPTRPETAEIVLLNSNRYSQIIVTPPSGDDPFVISLYSTTDNDPEECGLIGCDYLMEIHEVSEDVRWKDMKDFDIVKDKLIGRELPLPSKRGTESGDMTATTAAINVTSNERACQTIPRPQNTYQRKHSPLHGTTSTLSTIRPLGDFDTPVSEHQIKRLALEAFDRPGQCFYGDGDRFKAGHDYPLPNKLPNARVLREGGNGLVLEVPFEGQLYAVKQTAFRWREVLIMPKLRHKNILRLCSMLMGGPIEGYLRRRYVYHFYPKMTSDFGRLVGSFEKYSLRTLKDKYSKELLLLNKIHSNFKYVIGELLRGLNYLHTLPNPIIHRDIKPSNILVSMDCDCPNPLACVCRKRPLIVLSDFDASLELNPDTTLQPDPPRNTMQGFYTSSERVYHISPVGTIGFKSPEGFLHMVSNSADVLPPLSTKADIFSFGLVVLLMLINEEGPKSAVKIGVLLLSIKNKVSVNSQPKSILSNVSVTDSDINKILHIKKISNEFRDQPDLVDFVTKMLEIDPHRRPKAIDLLSHPYLKETTF